ncbi:MAG: hypothetical protein L0G14_03255 [Lactococcus lactis]|nr:hypothetical protein [Lactococcus lactis]
MRNLIYMMPILMILAFGMANKYKDDPKAPFELAITIGWWAFGITTLITIIVAVVSDKEKSNYVLRVSQLAAMPIVTLIAIGLIALMKNSIG